MLLEDRPGGLEGPLRSIDRRMRPGISAHEDIECRIAPLRPAMDADVPFAKYRDPGDAAVDRETMHVNVQQGCTRHFHAAFQRLFDVLEIVKPLRAEQVDD